MPVATRSSPNRIFLRYLVSYNNRDAQLPEQLSPISASRRSLLDTCTVSVVAHGIYMVVHFAFRQW